MAVALLITAVAATLYFYCSGSDKKTITSPSTCVNTSNPLVSSNSKYPGENEFNDAINLSDIDALLKYPMNEKSEYQEIGDIEEIQKTAEGFFMTNYNVDFRNIKDFKQKMLFYFSSSSNGDEWVDKRISDIDKFNIVSQGKFITSPSLIYVDNDYEIRVRGRLLIRYSSETKEEFLNKIGLAPDRWYYRDLEIFLTLAVDNRMWKRRDWTYLGCKYLSQYEKYQEG